MANAAGYAIFPDAGKGGLVVGGGFGHGTVYQNGMMIGYATITQATVGAQIGGQEFAQLMVFQTQQALDRFKNNEFQFAADASAVAASSGAAAAAQPKDGVLTFIKPKAGLMAGAVIGGQKFKFDPTGSAANTSSSMKESKTTETPSGTYKTEKETETK